MWWSNLIESAVFRAPRQVSQLYKSLKLNYSIGHFAECTEYRWDSCPISKVVRSRALTGLATTMSARLLWSKPTTIAKPTVSRPSKAWDSCLMSKNAYPANDSERLRQFSGLNTPE